MKTAIRQKRISTPSDVNVIGRRFTSLDQLLMAVGDVPPRRIRLEPFPARPGDVNRIRLRERRLFELVDGVLVEKTMGAKESFLALEIGYYLREFLESHDLGIALGADGILQVLPNQVRIPDLCFLSWQTLGSKDLPEEAIPELAPDLAVEVLSTGNTAKEMNRKVREYFQGGTKLVWLVDPNKQMVRVHSSATRFKELTIGDELVGGTILPGFRLPLSRVFRRLKRKNDKKR